jgi:SH3 domain protein
MKIKRNNKPFLFPILFCFIFVLLSVSGYADTQYVSDELIITLRQGMGNEYKIIKTLKTGTAVEVLEEVDTHYRVQTEDGQQGWVLKQYITTDIPKTMVISGLKEEVEKLRNNTERLRRERDALKEKIASVQSIHGGEVRKLEKNVNERNDTIDKLTRELKELTHNYNKLVEDSGDVVNIISERDILSEENVKLNATKNELLQENERLSERNAIFWFLAGGSVFLFGWIAGKFSRRRKSYY